MYKKTSIQSNILQFHYNKLLSIINRIKKLRKIKVRKKRDEERKGLKIQG